MNKEDKNFNYKKLHPFKWFILENYPFLEDSIDVLTNYQLFCKLGEMYNKQVDAINILGKQVEYISDWFDDLDVQEEVNNKLDAMVEDGTMAEIINQEIFGDIQTQITEIETNIDTLKRNALYIGNSYIGGVGSTGNQTGIYELTKNMFNETWKKTGSGIGFLTYTDHTDTFQTCLQNAINDSNIDNSEVTDVIVVSAWGDSRSLRETDTWSNYRSNLQTAISTFVTTCKNNFPNLKRVSCTLAESRSQKHIDDSALFDDPFWVNCAFNDLMPKNGMEYLGWIGFNIMLKSTYFSSDHYHPSDAGYKYLSTLFRTAYQGKFTIRPIKRNWASRPCNITSNSTLGGIISLTPDRAELTITDLRLYTGSTPANDNNDTLLFDFGVNLPFSLPMPAGQTTNLLLIEGFTCTTQNRTASDFSFNNNYNARISLVKSSDIDSTALKLTTFGASKTVASDNLLSICFPSQISWSLLSNDA